MQASHNNRILAILCSVLDAHSAVLFLPAEGVQEISPACGLAASFSLSSKLDYSTFVSDGQGLVGWILRNKEPLLVANFDQHKHRLGYYLDNEEQSIKAFMGCSLPFVRGALCIDSKRQYSFSEKDQKMLHLFADLIANLQTDSAKDEGNTLVARYYSALQAIYVLRRTHTRWTDFLSRFLELVTAMTDLTYCVFCTRDPGCDSYSVEGESSVLLRKADRPAPSYPMSNGIVGWVFRNSAPIVTEGPNGSPDTPLVGRGTEVPQFQTVMALPLIIHGKTRAVLCLAHHSPVKISAATQDFVQMASEHLALFLENLYIKCRLRDMYREKMSETAPKNFEVN